MKSTRKITTLLLFFSAICMFLTLLVLIFTPQGWSILGIRRFDFFTMHKTFGITLVILAINHIIINFNMIKTNMKNKSGLFPSKDFIIAVMIVLIIAVSAITYSKMIA